MVVDVAGAELWTGGRSIETAEDGPTGGEAYWCHVVGRL